MRSGVVTAWLLVVPAVCLGGAARVAFVSTALVVAVAAWLRVHRRWVRETRWDWTRFDAEFQLYLRQHERRERSRRDRPATNSDPNS